MNHSIVSYDVNWHIIFNYLTAPTVK